MSDSDDADYIFKLEDELKKITAERDECKAGMLSAIQELRRSDQDRDMYADRAVINGKMGFEWQTKAEALAAQLASAEFNLKCCASGSESATARIERLEAQLAEGKQLIEADNKRIERLERALANVRLYLGEEKWAVLFGKERGE